MDYENKNVLVVGAARSGISTARLLKKLGARVTLADNKPRENIADIAQINNLGIELYLGQNAGADIVKKQQLLVQSPGVPLEIETFDWARKLGIPIIGEMELAFTLCPCPVAAITGTNGKTTTAALSGEILKGWIEDTHVLGNIGIPFTECVLSLTEKSFVIAEASSFQLESVSVLKPKISVVLNIAPDHLDRHKTMDKYVEAKANIFKNADKSTFIVLNYDDEALRRLKTPKESTILYFSDKTKVEQGTFLKDGILTLRLNGAETPIAAAEELNILGRHNVLNALAAIALAACAGAPAEITAEGLRSFKGVSHRLEFVREINGVKYYNDSKGTNPDASIKALSSMRGSTVLIAGGYDKNSNFDDFTGCFPGGVSHLIVLGETKKKIMDSAIKMGFGSISEAASLEDAVSLASRIAVGGENVLLSPGCASWDMFKDYEERGQLFKQYVRDL